MKGRKPDPHRARRRTGHKPVRDGAAALALVAGDAAPEPPESLEPAAAAVWREMIDGVDPSLLRAGGAMLFRELCRAYAFADEAGREISRLGQIVKGERGPMVNPLLKVWRDSGMAAVRYAEQLGLTPAAHVRLGLQVLTGRSMAAQLEADIGQRA